MRIEPQSCWQCGQETADPDLVVCDDCEPECLECGQEADDQYLPICAGCLAGARELADKQRRPRPCADCGRDIEPERHPLTKRCVRCRILNDAERERRYSRERYRRVGGWVPHRFGPLLLLRDGSICHWCELTVHLGDGWHVDHFWPVSKFPDLADDTANWRLTHPKCNLAKSDQVPTPELAG